ncbi:patatin [Maritimibacter sp. 55A14]|uniref:patatin-like phospholipase family protein n=1 Tax=Maritimibacter sp. 55A14 TaxID=2174844 RepID=UPI000D612A76|nr:patatin-like phospholipase family protein [Maritimibacter sp. 55A14]PWE33167.1 patatin [Maritimibacter sp. 55A14]
MSRTRAINLALQGGGAHGAFTWGVLDRLLEDEAIEIAGISATSAGALNGAALKAGLLEGGRAGARENLDWLWRQIGALSDPVLADWMAAVSPPVEQLARVLDASPFFNWADAMGRILSPYALPGDNPLRRIVERFHWDSVCAMSGPALHICATNVRSGKVRVFTGEEICTDTILASACLPTLFRAVEWDDPATGRCEAFWDGGYTGNPALFPLFAADLPRNIVIVNINPLRRDAVPKAARDIQNRINEISFNSSLLRELRAIAFVKRLIAEGAVEPRSMKDVLVHMIADDALMTQLSVATKLMPNPVVLHRLKEAGRHAADRFLLSHRGDLGECGTVGLSEMFG